MRNGIWVRILNVLNLQYERLVHNSAKVVSLQVSGKFSDSKENNNDAGRSDDGRGHGGSGATVEGAAP